jgi:hypothetical protein
MTTAPPRFFLTPPQAVCGSRGRPRDLAGDILRRVGAEFGIETVARSTALDCLDIRIKDNEPRCQIAGPARVLLSVFAPRLDGNQASVVLEHMVEQQNTFAGRTYVIELRKTARTWNVTAVRLFGIS